MFFVIKNRKQKRAEPVECPLTSHCVSRADVYAGSYVWGGHCDIVTQLSGVLTVPLSLQLLFGHQ